MLHCSNFKIVAYTLTQVNIVVNWYNFRAFVQSSSPCQVVAFAMLSPKMPMLWRMTNKETTAFYRSMLQYILHETWDMSMYLILKNPLSYFSKYTNEKQLYVCLIFVLHDTFMIILFKIQSNMQLPIHYF